VTCGVVLVAWNALAAQQRPAIADVLKELRKIESAGYRGHGEELRMQYDAKAKEQVNDVMSRVYSAWCSMPGDDAWNQLKAISPMDPENPWIHLGMARVYARWKGMGDQAKTELGGLLLKDPGFYPAITGQAELALQKGDAAEAAKLFTASLSLGDDPRARSGLGLALLAQGKQAEGRAALEQALAAWPDQPAAQQALFKLLKDAGDPKAAQVAALIVELSPRNREARQTLAELYFAGGDQAKAVQAYEELVRLGNPEAPVLTRLAGLYRDQKNADAEERTLKSLAALEKDNPAPCARLAELLLARGKADLAEEQLKEAANRGPSNAAAWLALGKAQEARGVLYEAYPNYRKAAGLTGDGVEEAKGEVARVEKLLQLPAKKAKGSVDAIYGTVASSLNALFLARKSPGGSIKVRVKVGKEGDVQLVELVEDSVKDPVLAAHVFVALQEAQYPKQKREPVFEFELKGKKGK